MKRRLSVYAVLCVALLVAMPVFAGAQEKSSGSLSGMLGMSPKQPAPVKNGDTFAGLTPNQIHKKIFDSVTVFVIGYLLLFAIVGIINKRVVDVRARHTFRKNAIYLINFSLIAGIILIWLQNLTSFTVLLGFISAGLALALQEVILSVAGWVLILTRRPFETGDRIEINGIKGDIIDIRLFQTAMLEIGNWVDADQSTGRIVNVPNSYVFKYSHFNYSRGFEFIWNEIPVIITFESDWKKAFDIMTTIGKRHAEGLADDVQRKIDIMKNRYMIYYGKLTPIVYVNIKDSGILLTLRYLTEAKRRRSTQDEISRAILEEFAKEPTVNFAYTTYRIVKD